MAERFPSDWEDASDGEEVPDSWEDRQESDNETEPGEITQSDPQKPVSSTQGHEGSTADPSSGEEDSDSGSTFSDAQHVEQMTLLMYESDSEDSDATLDTDLSDVPVSILLGRISSSIHAIQSNLVDMLSDDQIFWVDGDSLLDFLRSQHTADWSHHGQFLYLTYMAEKYLQLFINKGGKVELVFFREGEILWKPYGPSVLLARRALITHFMQNTSLTVYTEFTNCFDTNWIELTSTRLPSFLLITECCEDGSNTSLGFYYNSLALMCQYINLAVVYIASVVNFGAKIMSFTAVPDQRTVRRAKSYKLTDEKLARTWAEMTSHNVEKHGGGDTLLTKKLDAWVRRLSPEFTSWAEVRGDSRLSLSVCASAHFLACIQQSPPGDTDVLDSDLSKAAEDVVRVFLLHVVLLHHLPLTHRAQRLPRGLEVIKQFDPHHKLLLPSPTGDTSGQPEPPPAFLQQMQIYMLETLDYGFVPPTGSGNKKQKQPSLADLMDGRLFYQLILMLLQGKAKGEPEPELPPEIREELSHCWSWVQKLAHSTPADQPSDPDMPGEDIGRIITSDVKMTGEDVWRPNAQMDPFLCEEPLLPIENRLVSEVTGDIQARMVTLSREEAERKIVRSQAKQFYDLYHWHSLQPLTDEFARTEENQSLCKKPATRDPWERKRLTRSAQKYRAYMHRYGKSLEGGDLTPTNITTNGSGQKPVKKLSNKARDIASDNKAKIAEKKKQTEETSWKFQQKTIDSLVEEGNFVKAMVELEDLCKSYVSPEVKTLVLEKKVKICFQRWTEICQRSSERQKGDSDYPAQILSAVEKLCSDKYRSVLSRDTKKYLAGTLTRLGFVEVAKYIWPEPIQMTEGDNLGIGTSSPRFQLLHMGHLLERDFPSSPDSRVTGFIPDDWQRKLLDIVDARQSALIVAPTSSGKTYASYYCIEQVLREGNDGIAVYVAPTKALVNQVAATVYARFSNKKMPPGKAVFGVFTRDYRQDAENCQVLITVPQCLEILLLCPHRQAWTSRLRYVIFDEVHCLGAEIGAEVWEHLILMIPCPFLALSATIANPDHLHSWMKNAKTFAHNLEEQLRSREKQTDRRIKRDREVHLVTFSERYADLKKMIFAPSQTDKDNEESFKGGQMFIPMHPFSVLDIDRVERKEGFPADLSLSPAETFRLYYCMNHVCGEDSRIKALTPEVFFADQLFLKRTKVRDYEIRMKEILLAMLVKEGKKSEVEEIVEMIRSGFNKDYHSFSTGWEEKYKGLPEGDDFGHKTSCTLMNALASRNLLPALVFCHNRLLCENMACKQCASFIDRDEKVNNTLAKQKEIKTAKKNLKAVKKEKKKQRDIKTSDAAAAQKAREADGLTKDHLRVKLKRHRLNMVTNKLSKEEIADLVRAVRDGRLVSCIHRGVGWHHAGANAKARGAVETLFRYKHVQLVTATGTLALGIHMPCKTVVIFSDSPYVTPLQFRQMSGRAGRRGYDLEGNVVFCGTRYPKIHQLINASMPDLRGNFPISVSLVLRLLLYVSSTNKDQEEALIGARTLLEHSFFCHGQTQLQHQVKHHFLFSLQFLLHLGLIDFDGNPMEMTGMVTHLHYFEPANFVFIQFLQKSLFHKLLAEEPLDSHGNFSEDTMKKLMIVLCHLFARKPEMTSRLQRKAGYNGTVFLKPLPREFSSALKAYNSMVKKVYQSYLSFVARYVAEEFGGDRTLPLSGLEFSPGTPLLLSKGPDREGHAGGLVEKLLQSASPNIACSTFVGTAGLQDGSLLQTNNLDLLVQSQVYADISVIPLMTEHVTDRSGAENRLNAYAYDFFLHGSDELIMRENNLLSGDAFNLLKDFLLVLKSISTSLKEMALKSPDDVTQDVVVKAFSQLSSVFHDKFQKAYPRYR